MSPHFTRWRDRISSHPSCVSTSVHDQSFNLSIKSSKILRLFVSSSVNDLRNEKFSAYSDLFLNIKKFLLNPIQFFLESAGHFIVIFFKILYYKPDLIHIHWLNSIASLVAVFVGKILKIPIILTAWGSDINDLYTTENKLFFRRILIKYQLKNANHITCDATHLEAKIVALGTSQNKISIIRFGTNTNYFKKSNDQSILRKQFGFKDSEFIILSNRPFEEVYDIETIVRAVHKFKEVTENFRFVLIGRGSKEEVIRQLVSNLKLDTNSLFIGYLSDEEFLNFIQLSNVYISAAKSDGGIAASTAEAMACERVCIVTEFGENSMWIKEGKTGYLFDIGSDAQLYSKLSDFYHSPEIELKIGASARKMIVDNLNLNLELEKTICLYKAQAKL